MDKEPRELDGLLLPERELFYSICAMTSNLQKDTKIVSSKTGVFDENSIKYYLPSLYVHLERLLELNLVEKSADGSLQVQPSLAKYVLFDLKITYKDMPALEEYFKNIFDFKLVQHAKDVEARLVFSKQCCEKILCSRELLDIYSFFFYFDDERYTRIYNLLMCLCLSKTGLSCCTFVDSLLPLLYSNLESIQDKLYGCDKDWDNVYRYTNKEKGLLDIIRICICAVKGIKSDMYERNKHVFQSLYDGMSELLRLSDNRPVDVRVHILDDMLRLCEESFSYSCAVSMDGGYLPLRDDVQNHEITYTGIQDVDERCAAGICMGKSVLTLKLYAVYYRCLCKWSELDSINANTCNDNMVLEKIKEQKCVKRQKTICDISLQFNRIVNGYDKYFDFFCKKQQYVDIDTYLSQNKRSDIKRLLERNKSQIAKGFGTATKRGAARFAKQYMNVLCNSKEAFLHLLLVLDTDFPISFEAYKCLEKTGFLKFVFESKSITNLDRQDLYIILVQNYFDAVRQGKCRHLYELILSSLCRFIKPTNTYRQTLFSAVCGLFVKSVVSDCFDDEARKFCKALYEKHKLSDTKAIGCACVVAGLVNNGGDSFERDVYSSFEALCYEYCCDGFDYDESVFLKLASQFLNGREYRKLCNVIKLCNGSKK